MMSKGGFFKKYWQYAIVIGLTLAAVGFFEMGVGRRLSSPGRIGGEPSRSIGDRYFSAAMPSRLFQELPSTSITEGELTSLRQKLHTRNNGTTHIEWDTRLSQVGVIVACAALLVALASKRLFVRNEGAKTDSFLGVLESKIHDRTLIKIALAVSLVVTAGIGGFVAGYHTFWDYVHFDNANSFPVTVSLERATVRLPAKSHTRVALPCREYHMVIRNALDHSILDDRTLGVSFRQGAMEEALVYNVGGANTYSFETATYRKKR